MSKKPAADDKKKPPAKKPAAGAKKPAAVVKKLAAKRAAAKPGKKPVIVEAREAAEAAAAAADVAVEAAEAAEAAADLAEELAEVGEVFVAPEAVAQLDPDVITSALPENEPELSEEEKQLSSIYGDDMSAPAQAHVEFSDRQTADEDRPMTPEINARDERRNRWDERRDQRRSRRDRGGRDGRPGGGGGGGGGGNNQGQPQQQNQNQQRNDGPRDPSRDQNRDQNRDQRQQQLALPVAVTPVNGTAVGIHDHDALARVGTPLGDAATQVFQQLRNNQPLPVKQLAAMMRKRNLVQIEPDHLWPQLKAELLGDERSYRTLGLRPRIVYRGRDLFAPGPVATSATADAEAGMAAALSRLAGATHRALAGRIARATAPGFERLIHAYLVAAGYRDIEWVKRVEGISYASVVAPGIERTILVSARAGDRPIDRRGIGELRVGVEAKNLVAGILFSAAGLSEDAERELERAGRSISVVCGDQLVATLIAAGVGVVSRTAPLHYMDDQLLDELMQG